MKINASALVMEMQKINFGGNSVNIIPLKWYKALKIGNNTDLAGITVLSDICYWYTPTIILDERTGEPVEIKNKFSGDILQKNARQLHEKFGLSERQCRSAIERLVSAGLIEVEVRAVHTASGVIPKVMFIKPCPDAIKKITDFTEADAYDIDVTCPDPYDIQVKPSDIQVRRNDIDVKSSYAQCHTTVITTENIQENNARDKKEGSGDPCNALGQDADSSASQKSSVDEAPVEPQAAQGQAATQPAVKDINAAFASADALPALDQLPPAPAPAPAPAATPAVDEPLPPVTAEGLRFLGLPPDTPVKAGDAPTAATGERVYDQSKPAAEVIIAAGKLGFDAAAFKVIVDAILAERGELKAVNLEVEGSDAMHNDARHLALSLITLNKDFATAAAIKAIFEAADHDWPGNTNTVQISKIASKIDAGKLKARGIPTNGNNQTQPNPYHDHAANAAKAAAQLEFEASITTADDPFAGAGGGFA